jgi:CxxC motif-containing protein (DUF1111 family)
VSLVSETLQEIVFPGVCNVVRRFAVSLIVSIIFLTTGPVPSFAEAVKVLPPFFIEIDERETENPSLLNHVSQFNAWVWQNLGVIVDLDNYPPEALSAGEATAPLNNEESYSAPLTNIDRERLREFALGRHLFRRIWVAAPDEAENRDGLGPTFNRTSCVGCHFQDGRGRAPSSPDEPMKSMLIRLSIPGADANGGPLPHPVYGGQLQDNGIEGVPSEGRATISYAVIDGAYADGKFYRLSDPSYNFSDLGHGAFGSDILYSPRVAPAIYGLGLLEAVDESTIAALADPDDADGDGISGKMNRVWNGFSGQTELGRFGWKANTATIYAQVAGAAIGDMGITSSAFPRNNCLPAQGACVAAPDGGAPELSDSDLASLVLYSRSLAVPVRRKVDDPTVLRGEELFEAAGCVGCHKPTLETGSNAVMAELNNQTIRPYTDLLLHDMGEGLADGRPDYLATGREWRTPPLWGIGLLQRVNLHLQLLHDGRARGFMEAILWHGGEGEAARDAVIAMPKEDRLALVAFLRSL